jgi:hypothetical protein
VIADQVKNYKTASEELEALKVKLGIKGERSTISKANVAELESLIQQIQTELQQSESAQSQLLQNDEILEEVVQLFEGFSKHLFTEFWPWADSVAALNEPPVLLLIVLRVVRVDCE